jgi:hypothetical protein
MFKKLLPAITGAIGFAFGGPMGASIGAGLGSAIRGDNPANIATSALMGFGLGSFGQAAGFASDILRGVPTSQIQYTSQPSPSLFQQVAGLGIAGLSTLGALGGTGSGISLLS